MVKSKSQIVEKFSPEQETGDGALSRARTAVADRRTAILDCAEEIFLDKGFQAASMAGIAATLGGSKGTLYNYFPSKEDLFIACVTRRCERLQDQISSVVTEGQSLEDSLFRIGKRFVEVVYADETVAQYRMIVAEVSRTPELAQAFYLKGPCRGAELMADHFSELREQGLLEFDDPLRTARHFASLCDSMFAEARHCGAMQTLDLNSVDEEVRWAVRAFLAAYGAKPK
jgi:AcrR family transcriptional regulator